VERVQLKRRVDVYHSDARSPSIARSAHVFARRLLLHASPPLPRASLLRLPVAPFSPPARAPLLRAPGTRARSPTTRRRTQPQPCDLPRPSYDPPALAVASSSDPSRGEGDGHTSNLSKEFLQPSTSANNVHSSAAALHGEGCPCSPPRGGLHPPARGSRSPAAPAACRGRAHLYLDHGGPADIYLHRRSPHFTPSFASRTINRTCSRLWNVHAHGIFS